MFEPNEKHLTVLRAVRGRMPVSGMTDRDHEQHEGDLLRERHLDMMLGGPVITAKGRAVLNAMDPRQ